MSGFMLPQKQFFRQPTDFMCPSVLAETLSREAQQSRYVNYLPLSHHLNSANDRGQIIHFEIK